MLNFNNKNLLIYGFGISGQACFNYLKKNNQVRIYDDSPWKLNEKYKKYYLSKNLVLKSKYDYLILSPGININKCSLKKYIKKNKNKIINELDIFYFHYPKNKKITITGTNGKSTTAKIIYDVMKKSKRDVRLVGNIGKPLLNEINVNKKTEFVIEASSYQIDYSKYFKTDFAIITNISPDHLDRHKTFLNYAKVKFKLIKKLEEKGIAIIKKNNFFLEKFIKNNYLTNKIIRISSKPEKKFIRKIKNNYFKNLNNLENLNFCIKISKYLNLKESIILKSINSFNGLPFRQQIIFDNKNLLIMNDSKSTSFSSTVNHLKNYKNIFWILGGIPKIGDKFVLEKKFFRNIKAYIYGENSNFFIKILKKKINYKIYKNLSNLVDNLIIDIKADKKKKNIIFSPASASFDQFKNFEKRGEYFNFIIKNKNFINRVND